MPMNSNEEDKRLFEFYLEHGYFPDDFKYSKENNNLIKDNKTKYFYSKKKSYNKFSNEKDLKAYTKEDEEMFLWAVKNLNCTNHHKKFIDINKNNTKYKPNIKNSNPKDILDLHGFTREIALNKIRKFIMMSKKYKLSPILIIHGKGFRSENGIAVLKDLVEYYIATEGKYYIEYSSDAPPKLGGTGAKIIYLKI